MKFAEVNYEEFIIELIGIQLKNWNIWKLRLLYKHAYTLIVNNCLCLSCTIISFPVKFWIQIIPPF